MVADGVGVTNRRSNGAAPVRTAVVIVGAGPAGLVLALMLHRAGIPHVVVERRSRTELGGPPKAGSIDYRTVRILTEVGIAPSIIDFTVENGRCEFRSPSESVVLEYGELTGGRPHFIYPQHLLVERLRDGLLDAGGSISFGTELISVVDGAVAGDGAEVAAGAEGDHFADRADGARVRVRDENGMVTELVADVVVGCDGARSSVGPALDRVAVTEVMLPVRLLAVIAPAPPLVPHTVYGTHPRGFAGQMRRGPNQTRYYLEVPGTDAIADWPEDRVRAELSERLGVQGRLDDISFGDMSLVDLRVKVTEPMQQGRLFLAGDAAHLITPAAGKGMNLAIHDAIELAYGIIERFGPAGRGGDRLAAYSATRLALIWRTQAFSFWFLQIMLANVVGGAQRAADAAASSMPAAFSHGMRNGWVASLQRDPLLARWFAHAYAGVDPPATG